MAERHADATVQRDSSANGVKRRGLMAGAAAMAAGIIAKHTTPPVAANTGSTFMVGQSPTTVLFNNFAQNPTALTYNGTNANLIGHNILTVQEGTFGDTASTNPAALAGMAGPITRYGVFGSSTAANGIGVYADGGNGGTTTGLFATGSVAGVVGSATGSGYGGTFGGGLAPLLLAPAATPGAPTTGAHLAGELYVDSKGVLYFCSVNGSPGTFVKITTTPVSIPIFTALPTPERFVDTRINLGGVQGPVPGTTTHTFQMTGRGGESGNLALVIPDAATTIVGNLTVLGGAGIAPGSFVTLWPGGPQPTVSNINVGPGQSIANSYVVGLSGIGGHGVVSVYNQAMCDYILDVTGYFVSTPSAAKV